MTSPCPRGLVRSLLQGNVPEPVFESPAEFQRMQRKASKKLLARLYGVDLLNPDTMDFLIDLGLWYETFHQNKLTPYEALHFALISAREYQKSAEMQQELEFWTAMHALARARVHEPDVAPDATLLRELLQYWTATCAAHPSERERLFGSALSAAPPLESMLAMVKRLEQTYRSRREALTKNAESKTGLQTTAEPVPTCDAVPLDPVLHPHIGSTSTVDDDDIVYVEKNIADTA